MDFPDEENRLLLIHGIIDENVHFRHTSLIVNALIKVWEFYVNHEEHSRSRLVDLGVLMYLSIAFPFILRPANRISSRYIQTSAMGSDNLIPQSIMKLQSCHSFCNIYETDAPSDISTSHGIKIDL